MTTLAGARTLTQMLAQYSYLQLLDLLTTIAFLMIGVKEGNPVVRLVLTVAPNPIIGLAVIKAVALLLGLYCWRMGRERLLARVNFFFALVVAWNLVALICGMALSSHTL